jgi:hypothetical protein
MVNVAPDATTIGPDGGNPFMAVMFTDEMPEPIKSNRKSLMFNVVLWSLINVTVAVWHGWQQFK